MRLSELKLIEPKTEQDVLRKKVVSQFRLDTKDASEVAEFLLGIRDWEDLSNSARSKIFSYYENDSFEKEDPISLLKKDFS